MKTNQASTILVTLLMASQANAVTSFNDVKRTLSNQNPLVHSEEARQEILVYQRGELPRYSVSASSFVSQGVNLLAAAAKRTINEKQDIYPRIEKLVHPNGVCLTGEWSAVGNSPYTGYFARGKKGLLVLRVSTATSGTRRGEKRGFGIVGKLFPTMNPDQKVKTAHFFTVDVLTGTDRAAFLGVETTNNPKIGKFGLSLVNMIAKLTSAFLAADKDLLYRPVYEIAEAGLPAGQVSRQPKYLKVSTRGVYNDSDDFRDELNINNFHPAGLVFTVHGSETSSDPAAGGWTKLAELNLKESFVSYGCDRQIHFAHPKSR